MVSGAETERPLSGPGRMLIVMLMWYSNSFVSRTSRVFFDEKLLKKTGIRNWLVDSLLVFIHNLYFTHMHVCTYTDFHSKHSHWTSCTNSCFLTLAGNQSAKAHCFDSRHMSSRRRVCRLINHLAANDLWREWPYHDKVSEPCTFNYRSEGSTYISMQHPSPLLLIALQ